VIHVGFKKLCKFCESISPSYI